MDWQYPLATIRSVITPWSEWVFIGICFSFVLIMLTCSIPPIIDLKRLKRRLWQRKGIERRKTRVISAPPKEYLK